MSDGEDSTVAMLEPDHPAMERVQFAPRIEDGRPVEQHGVVYPMEFRME